MKVKVVLLSVFCIIVASNSFAFNYGEALQKAIYFYECQVTGPKPSWNRCSWRGDSCMNDAVPGGWHDAGDHIKFGLPMAYSASMLGWAAYEYPDAFSGAGQMTALKNNLKFVCDYFMACGQGSSFVYQIGDPGPDHAWWGPIEVIEKKMTRPSYTCNASCVTAGTAAALALGYLVLGDASYLTRAKALFTSADTVRSDASYTAASGFYSSWSGFWDELMWSALWLYMATNDSSYITKAESYIPNLPKVGDQDQRIDFQWTHCWDDCHYGAYILLARVTGKQEYYDYLNLWLDWWTVGTANDGKITYTPGGLAWLDSWGSLRYASTTAFCAFVYSDLLTDTTLKNRYRSFAETQIEYALGDNPRSGSYLCGYGTNPPVRPHHRTSHGSWCDQQTTPAYHRHVLHGALVGGPSNADAYVDEISNFTTNEVACDYNAGFVASLAKMYSLYGGQALANFPPAETPEDEFFCEAMVNSAGTDYTEIRVSMNNRSSWPARLIKNLSFNYYIDISEVLAKGLSVADLKVEKSGSEIATTNTGLTQYSGNIYSIKVTFTDGTQVMPVDQSSYSRDVTFRISAPNASGAWDPSNDPSYQGITSAAVKTVNIPVYDGITLIFGKEPNGPNVTPVPSPEPTVFTTPDPTSPPATPAPTTLVVTPEPTGAAVLLGDVNSDGNVNIVDALQVAQHYVGNTPANFNPDAADVNRDGTITIVDALRIAQCYVGLISCVF